MHSPTVRSSWSPWMGMGNTTPRTCLVCSMQLRDHPNISSSARAFMTKRIFRRAATMRTSSRASGFHGRRDIPSPIPSPDFACLRPRFFKKIKHRDVACNGFVFESEVLIEAGALGMQSIAIAILGIYPKQARPSHFRPLFDIARIVVVVAGRLLRRGMHTLGLWRSPNLPMAIEIASELVTLAGNDVGDERGNNASGLRQ